MNTNRALSCAHDGAEDKESLRKEFNMKAYNPQGIDFMKGLMIFILIMTSFLHLVTSDNTITEPSVQRGAARVMYGSGSLRAAAPPAPPPQPLPAPTQTTPKIKTHGTLDPQVIQPPPPGYAVPPPGYAVPPPGYAVPPPGYANPPPGYANPPPGYAIPPPQVVPPPGYDFLDFQYPPEVPYARSGARVPNGSPYGGVGVGGNIPPVGNGRIGDRGGIYGRNDHLGPGKGRGINPGINPNYRQEASYGINPNRISSIVHGKVIDKPMGGRGSRLMQGEDDLLEDNGDGDDDEGCRAICSKGEFECSSNCGCIKLEHRCDGDIDCDGGEDEADCRPGPARAPCLESDGKLRCPRSALCISKEWLCDGDDDCGDFSDETHCGKAPNCTADQFECSNGFCIPRSWMCDDYNDCKDNSDELNCTKIECGESEYKCADGRCISLVWRCDRQNDCDDGSDEMNCPIDPPICTEGEFQCHNRKCIRRNFKCDGENDCDDWSDEDGCPMVKGSCNAGEFKCNDGKCLPAFWKCDKERDCDAGEDEEGCGAANYRTCTPDEFTCADGRCILLTWVCDGVPDCSNGDDEVKCEVSCEVGQFMCKAHTNNTISTAFRSCVNRKHICDGQKDCPLGDDEDNCPVRKDCDNSSKCEQICITTAAGKPACQCNQGYIMADDGFSCRDIDECMYEQDPVCSQTCSNTIGSFTCGCMTGYVLRPDLRTCKALGASPTLLFTNRAEVRQVSLNSEKYTSVLKGLHNAAALDYHYEKKLIFWAEVTLNSIRVANVNGTNINVVIKWGLNQPAGVSVDWVHNLLFWTDSGTRRVEVATLDGRHRSVVAACDLDKPRAIAVHPGDANVFWTDWGTSPSPKIERADMDGSNRKSIVTESIFWPNGLTIDYTTSRIYWADAKHHVIESAHFDGSDRKKVVSKGLPHPYAITIFEDAIFWTDWHTKSISTVNKKTGVGFQTVHSGLSFPMDIHSFHPQRQPPYNNHCGPNNGGCSHMCLPNRASYSCQCPIGSMIGPDGRICEDTTEKLLLFAQKREIRIKYLESRKPETNIDMVIPLNGVKSAFSLAWDQVTNSIFWTDIEKFTINRASLNGSQQGIVISTSLSNATGLAYDWITDKLYWTDEGSRRIEVCTVDGRMRTVLIWDQLDKPRDIVVDPLGGFMFWSDWGRSPSINSAHMDGSNRKRIIFNGLVSPQSLAIDYARSRIYWADVGTRRIEHAKFDGSDRVIIMDLDEPYPVGLDIFGEEIFWTDRNKKSIHSANKITGKGQKTLFSNSRVLNDVQVYHKERKMGTNRCGKNNGGCSHLCLLKPNGYSCRCPIGVKLNDDKKTCANGPTNYLIFAHRIDIRQISLDVPYITDVALPLPRLKNALAVDVDRKTGEIYWTDTAEDMIHKATPDGRKVQAVVTSGLLTADGIVIDSTGRKMYWTDAGRNSIEVAELDGSNRKLLIWSDLDSPRAITLHYHKGRMYWSDWGAHAKIERADMNGLNRKTVINDNLLWPNGLAIDRPAGRLYWNDAKRQLIESSDLNGNDRRAVIKEVPYPYGLVVVGSHVYWTDWKTQALHRAEKKTGLERVVIIDKLEGLMDVRSVQADNIAENACGEHNGGCSHLCLRSPDGFTCACPTGTLFIAHPPNSTNVSTTDCYPHPNNYLIFATRTSLARVSLDTPELWEVTLPVSDVKNAIAVDFSWEKRLIFYTDVNLNVIRSVNMLDNTDTRTIIADHLETPNGLAVDWIANNIYWTDNDLKSLEVARLDGTCRKKLITEGLDEPRAMAIFPRKGYIYWTDWGDNPLIERAMLDGSSRKVIINTDLGFPNGLALDYKLKRLYWADALKDRIETSDLNGGYRVQLVPEAKHPFGLTQFGDFIYWTDWYKRSVMRANKTTGKNVTAIKTDLGVVMEIKAVSAERQKGWNPCREGNGGCSHLCLFTGENYTCACPDVPDRKPCSTIPTHWVPIVRPDSGTAPDEYDQEKEYDERLILPEIFNKSIPDKPIIQPNPGTHYLVVISVCIAVLVILIGIFIAMSIIYHKKARATKEEYNSRGNRVISFPNPNYSGSAEGNQQNAGNNDRRRINRFQIFKYDKSQERVTNVYSPEGASLITAPSIPHTPSSSRCTVTPESHPSPQHDGFDSIALNPIG